MNRMNVVIAGLLSLATPACDKVNARVAGEGRNHAQAAARKIVSECTLPGQPVSDCLKRAETGNICKLSSYFAGGACDAELWRIKHTGKFDN